ncbi:RNase A-like domain-containing protein [Enterococcus villorum]|nr:RNase A-like domain-containing protein [Enterococcus villorum]
MDKIKEFKEPNNDEDDEDKAEWYTPLDLYYDEYFANGGKGHTIARHVGKTEYELKMRFKEETFLKYSATFDNIVQALIAINAGIFTANQNYLDGKIKLSLGDCSFDSQKNRIEYDSENFVNLGWGVKKLNDDDFKQYNSIRYAKVIIQKTNNKIRKNRKYYIVTAFPNLKRHANEIDPFISEAF